jgi:hypothetical protein
MAGFVLVKKVPGTLHFTARGEGHSFDHAWMNMTHMVHQLHFGTKPSPRKLWVGEGCSGPVGHRRRAARAIGAPPRRQACGGMSIAAPASLTAAPNAPPA